MQSKHSSISRHDELNYHNTEASVGALPRHLWARIARRPGRWRRRMQSGRLRREEELLFDEAA